MKKAIQLLVALALAFAAATVRGEDRRGIYVGVGVMSVATDNADDFATAFRTSGERSGAGLKVYGGHLWDRYGVEVGYYDLGTYDVSTGGTKTDQFSVSAVSAAGVFSMPFAQQFVFNAKLGLAVTSAEYTCISQCTSSLFSSKKSGVAGLIGAGVGWRPAGNFTLRADFESFGGVLHRAGVHEADFGYFAISLSGQYNF